MTDFKSAYMKLCQEHHIEPQTCVLTQVKTSNAVLSSGKSQKSQTRLDLSTNSLSLDTCALLSQVLVHDKTFTELKLADCMLSDDGGKLLVNGLCGNTSVMMLDMKGNNLRSGGAESLGRLLRQNHTIASICLEWNALGMWDTSFTVFAEGVACNNSLKHLDLRNNQITHDGATELAAALKRNNTLESLDLRWNNVGILGGRALLSMLPHNKTLRLLDVTGNNIPNDIMKAIETTVNNNNERQGLSKDYEARTEILTRELRHVQNEKRKQLSELMDRIDKQDSTLTEKNQSASYKIGQLQEALDERKTSFNKLSAKLKMVEAELLLSDQKSNGLEDLLKRSKRENGELSKRHQLELKDEKQERHAAESRLHHEFGELRDRNVESNTKVSDVEKKTERLTEENGDLKEQVTRLQTDLRLKSAEVEERVNHERKRSKDCLREQDEIRAKEVTRLRAEYEDSEKSHHDRIQRLEQQRLDLEEDLGRSRTTALSDKINSEEEIAQARQRIKHEEEQRSKHLEDKLRLLQKAKDDLDSYSSNQNSTIHELQSKVSSLTLETENLKRNINDLTTDVANKNIEVASAVSKTRTELNQTIGRLQNENSSYQEAMDKLSKTERKISDKDRELDEVMNELRQQNCEIQRMKDDESQRLSILQSAISNYVTSASTGRSPYTKSLKAPSSSRDISPSTP